MARGIDFHHVSAVLNFDLPPTPEAYIHRAGRWESWGWWAGTGTAGLGPEIQAELSVLAGQRAPTTRAWF